MIVSTAIVVFPVERSPMISWRWPRPIGVIASIALTPVCSGSFTGWRWMTPGALNSSDRRPAASIGPRPSSGSPSGSTTRPSSASPTGTLMTSPVRRTGSPSLTCCHSPNSATPTLSSSRLNAIPVTPCSSSSRSRATQFSRPWTRAMPSPSCRTVPTSLRSVSTSNSRIRSLRIAVISSGRSFTLCSFGLGSGRSVRGCKLAPKSLEATTDAAVGAERADLEDDAADERLVDRARRFDRPARRSLDRVNDGLGIGLGKLVRRRKLDRETVLGASDERCELLVHHAELAGAALLCCEAYEVPDELVRARANLVEDIGLPGRVHLRIPEEGLERGHVLEGSGERGEVGRDGVDPVLVPRGLEERACIQALRHCHARPVPVPAPRSRAPRSPRR